MSAATAAPPAAADMKLQVENAGMNRGNDWTDGRNFFFRFISNLIMFLHFLLYIYIYIYLFVNNEVEIHHGAAL